jgi:MFS superfamily sulfate permease-like transporter
VRLATSPSVRRAGILCVQARGVLFFANAEKLAGAVAQAAAAATTVVVDLRAVLAIDATAALALQRAIAAAGAGRVLLAGVGRGPVAAELANAGLQPCAGAPWFESREHAFAWTGCRSLLPQALGQASNDQGVESFASREGQPVGWVRDSDSSASRIAGVAARTQPTN